MIPLAIALAVAVLTLLWFAAKPHTTNHAEQDENATGSGGLTHNQGDHYDSH